MALQLWRPQSLGMLPRWMDNWFEEDFLPEMTVRDGLDVYETDNEVVVKAAVPGIPKNMVDVTFEDGVLRIQARYEETEEEKKKKKNVIQERRMRAFDYATTLTRAVEADKITAVVEDGIVTVKAPITAASKPKRIAVKAGG